MTTQPCLFDPNVDPHVSEEPELDFECPIERTLFLW